MNIYCNGVFDLFHEGHLRQLETLASIAQDVKLIVGIVGDVKSSGYKRDSIWTVEQRAHILRSLKCVDSVVSPCPSVLTESFIEDQNIDVVYHVCTSSDDDDDAVMKEIFAVPIALGIFHTIPYNPDL